MNLPPWGGSTSLITVPPLTPSTTTSSATRTVTRVGLQNNHASSISFWILATLFLSFMAIFVLACLVHHFRIEAARAVRKHQDLIQQNAVLDQKNEALEKALRFRDHEYTQLYDIASKNPLHSEDTSTVNELSLSSLNQPQTMEKPDIDGQDPSELPQQGIRAPLPEPVIVKIPPVAPNIPQPTVSSIVDSNNNTSPTQTATESAEAELDPITCYDAYIVWKGRVIETVPAPKFVTEATPAPSVPKDTPTTPRPSDVATGEHEREPRIANNNEDIQDKPGEKSGKKTRRHGKHHRTLKYQEKQAQYVAQRFGVGG